MWIYPFLIGTMFGVSVSAFLFLYSVGWAF